MSRPRSLRQRGITLCMHNDNQLVQQIINSESHEVLNSAFWSWRGRLFLQFNAIFLQTCFRQQCKKLQPHYDEASLVACGPFSLTQAPKEFAALHRVAKQQVNCSTNKLLCNVQECGHSCRSKETCGHQCCKRHLSSEVQAAWWSKMVRHSYR